MTRKEAKNFNWFNNDREAIEKHIDKIYDHFESGSCSSCKWEEGEVCANGKSPLCADFINTDMMCGFYEKAGND